MRKRSSFLVKILEQNKNKHSLSRRTESQFFNLRTNNCG